MLAARSAGDRRGERRLDEVEGERAAADQRHRRRVDQREQAAQAEAERLAGKAEGGALGAVGGTGAPSQRRHLVVADVGHRLGIVGQQPGAAPDRIAARIGLDAAAPPAAAERPVRPMHHVAELAARRLRAAEELALQHQAHADAVRQQDGDEVLAVALRLLPAQRHRDHAAVVLDRRGHAEGVLQDAGEGDVACAGDRRPQHAAGRRVGGALDGDDDAGERTASAGRRSTSRPTMAIMASTSSAVGMVLVGSRR